jgi:hypothetical protein
MNVFTSLLGEIKGVFGKEYFLAGLLPAGVFMFAWHWFADRRSANSVVGDIERLLAGDTVAELGAAALAAMALALILFAARSWTTRFFETLPGGLLRPLRVHLLRRQWSAYANAKMAQQVQLHLYSVVEKWTGDEEFAAGQKLPTFEKRLVSPQDTRRLSNLGLQEFLDVVNGVPAFLKRWRRAPAKMRRTQSAVRPPTATEAKHIIGGLRALFAAVQKDGVAPWQREVDHWRKVVRSPRGSVVINVIRDHVHRTWVDTRRVMERFPAESKWIGPTRLGTRAAALDDYAEKRYGVDTSMLMTRLAGVLEDADRQGLSDARLSVEVLINLAVAMAAVAGVVLLEAIRAIVISIAQLDFAPLRFDLRAAAFLVLAIVFSVVFYRAAFHAYSRLAERVTRIVDLYRLKLIKGLGLPIPQDMDEEQRLWSQLKDFFWNGTPLRPPPPLKLGE